MGEYFTNKQRKEAAVDWWLQYSPDASWARLAGELYYNNETTALEAVSQYIPKDSAGIDSYFSNGLLLLSNLCAVYSAKCHNMNFCLYFLV